MEELENYRATAALNVAGVNFHEANQKLREKSKKHKERYELMRDRLSTATTERDKLQKSVKGYESILLNLKKYLEGEKETAEYTHVPHLLDYIKELERVARK